MTRDEQKSKAQLLQEQRALQQRVAELTQAHEEQERLQKALHSTDARYHDLLESASDGIVLVSPSRGIVRVNARAEEMFGYHRDELLGQPIEILVPERVRETHHAHHEKFLANLKSRPMGLGLDLMGRRRDGSEFPVEISLSITPSEQGSIVTCFIADISERKRIEAAVQRTLETLQERNRDLALLNQAGQALTATLDPLRVIARLLHAVTETIGAQASSVWLWDKEQPGWLVCQGSLDRGQGDALTNLRLAPGQGIAGWAAQHGESVIASDAPKDPRFSPEIDALVGFHTRSLLAVPLWLREEVIGVLEVVNKLEGEFGDDDKTITQTLAASAAIALDNARLVEELRQHTLELQQRNEELDAFAHTVAHDLKGPIGIMVGFAQALDESLENIPPDELRRHLRTITRNGVRMNNIIKELLLMANVRTAELEILPLDMASVVAESLDRLIYLMEASRAEIIVPPSWPTALGYAPWIDEVWVNYISNAMKYGGDPPVVELGATTSPDGNVRFWVCDNGPGIAPADQERLFTPFTQLQLARAQGHGLGLSIVKRIVEKLGGQVGVESQPGQGSTFFFTLPSG